MDKICQYLYLWVHEYTVHDAVRKGHQTMNIIEDCNNASAEATPETHQRSAGPDKVSSPARRNCSDPRMLQAPTCVHVGLEMSDWMKNTQK